MSIRFQILPSRGLVYVRYEGTARVVDSFAAFMDYAQHPDFRPGQKQLVDLSRVTDFENDFAKLMDLQAVKAQAFMQDQTETLLVYFAPGEVTWRMARLAANSWGVVPQVIPRVIRDEAEALAVLGCPERTISALLQAERTQANRRLV